MPRAAKLTGQAILRDTISFESIFQECSNRVCVDSADEEATSLLLENCIRLKDSNRLNEANNGSLMLRFESCQFDERFFNLLTKTDWSITRLSLIFDANCRLNLRDEASVVTIMNCLSAIGKLHLHAFVDVSSELSIELKVHGRCDKISSYSYPANQSSDLNSAPFIRRVERDRKDSPLSDSPFFLALLRLPNVAGVFAMCKFTKEFSLNVFNEFSKRPSFALPCYVIHPNESKLWYVRKVLDSFNDVKLRNFDICMGYDEIEDMETLLLSVLKVLSQSVYLDQLIVFVEKESDYKNLLFFLRELRKLTPKMRGFRLVVKSLCFAPDDTSSTEMAHLTTLIHQINNRSVPASATQTSADSLRRNDYRSFLIMFSASQSLISTKDGSACVLKMLPLNIIRHLHVFLCD